MFGYSHNNNVDDCVSVHIPCSDISHNNNVDDCVSVHIPYSDITNQESIMEFDIGIPQPCVINDKGSTYTGLEAPWEATYYGLSPVDMNVAHLTNNFHQSTMEANISLAGDKMSLAVVTISKENDVVFASDSRSTRFLQNNEVVFNDTERKIFPVNGTSVILSVTGANRFAPNESLITAFTDTYQGGSRIDLVAAALKNWLLTYAYRNENSTFILVDVKRPKDSCVVFVSGNDIRHEWHHLEQNKIICSGCTWGVNIAGVYGFTGDTTKELIISIKDFFDKLYELKKVLLRKEQVIAPPTQIFVGHLDGDIEKVL